MTVSKLTSLDVSHYFLSKTDDDSGDSISNLKLQKLVYLAQGFHLAIYDKKLFNEPIEAWTHGPVIDSLYHKFKEFGSNGIPAVKINLAKYSKNIKNLLEEIWEVYGQFSAWKLRNITHDHTPWKETSPGSEINLDSMKLYFKTLLKTA